MTTSTFTITGEVNVELTITKLPDSTLRFDIKVLDDTESIGDLNALYFDLFDDDITESLVVFGDDVTGVALKEDGVTKVDNFTNMNGDVIKDLGKFDGGIQFGTQGIATDDIRETSFTIASTERALSLADFSLQDFGVRLTSVGEEGGSREGSLKLGGTAPEFSEEPPEPEAPVHIAFADTMTVLETETFNPNFDGFEFRDDLDNNATSVLQNDTTDDGAYSGLVTTAGGSADGVAQVIYGSDGGAIMIFADGTVDFTTVGSSGINDFTYLEDNQSAQTTFEYGIEGGSTATLTVNVLGLSDIAPPPPDGDGGPIGVG